MITKKLFFRSLADEIHELVELRRDDNLRATVALLARSRCVVGNGVVLATATGSETLRVYAILRLQSLDDAGGTET